MSEPEDGTPRMLWHCEVPSDTPDDIRLMNVWAKSLESYKDKMKLGQLRAALNWFRDYSECVFRELERKHDEKND